MGLFKKDYIIGLDMGAASLKLAIFLKKEDGGLLLEGLKSEDVPDGQSRDAALRKLFLNIDIGNSKVIAAINSSGTMVKRAVVPRMPPAELRDAIRLEARNYFPFDISDSLLDFEESGEVSEKGVKKIEVLAGVSPNKAIRECLESLSRAGIKASAFIPQGLALRNLLALRAPAEKLAGEIERSFDFYREESSGMKVNKFILSGGGSRLKGLERFLSAELGIEVERINSWAGLKTKENLSAGQGVEMFAIAVGAGLSLPQGLNLLPAEVKDEVRIGVKNAGLKAAVSAVSTLLILIFIALRINLKVLDKKIAAADIELSAVRQRLLAARDLSFISRISSALPYREDVFKEISNVAGPDLYLKEISFHNQQIILRGDVVPEADAQGSIAEFTRRLEGGMFKNVRFSRQGREFQLQMEIG